VLEVQAKSSAAAAGLRAGATIHLTVKGEPDLVTESDGIGVRNARALSRLIADTPPGRTVDVTVRRDGRVRTFKVTPTLGRVLG
jgi:S1-C subfamily serine protease